MTKNHLRIAPNQDNETVHPDLLPEGALRAEQTKPPASSTPPPAPAASQANDRTVSTARLQQAATLAKVTLVAGVALHLLLLASLALHGADAGALRLIAVHLLTVALLSVSAGSLRYKNRHEAARLKGDAQRLQGELALVHEQLLAARQDVLLAQESAQANQRHDPNTGALTMEAFLDEVNREIESSRRTEVPICMLILQADHPDEDGESLKNLARVLGKRIRTSDRLAAVSDDQLAILLHNTTIADATPVCETFVGRVHAELNLAVSAGLTELISQRDRAGSLLSRTRQALEHARSTGGDRLSVIDVNQPLQRLRPVP